jgi:hypothetical protein
MILWHDRGKRALHPMLNKSDSSLLLSGMYLDDISRPRSATKEALQSANRKEKHLHHSASVLI